MSDPIHGATPLVSAIIPVHNGAAFLAAAIRNVLDQDWSPLEIIVVDDGSTDGTAGIAAQFGDAIRYAHQARGGPASARNRGIRMARGELLAFLDVDDLWPRGKVRRQAGFLAADAAVDIVQGLIVRMELDPSAPGPDPAFEECFEPYQFINLGSAVYRASVFDTVGPFDVALRENEDMDWFIRAWEANVAKVVQDQVALFHRRHAGNMTLEKRRPQLRIVSVLKRHLDRLRSRKLAAQVGAAERPGVAAYIGMPPSEQRADRVGADHGEVTEMIQSTPAQPERVAPVMPGAVSGPAGASVGQPADLQCNFARIWRQQGKPDKAALSFRRALELDPSCEAASLGLGGLLRDRHHLDEAIEVYKSGLERSPNAAELHKALVDALVERGGLAEAEAYYGLERQDALPVEIRAGDVLVCSVMRNEAPRLPYFLAYYRRQGIARFLIVDNGSTDETLPYLLAQPDVYAWRSSRSFNRANFGAGWFDPLLRRHGVGHWCLIVDADELLMYDRCERRDIPSLCRDLDLRGKRVLTALLLDMYADRSIADTRYTPGQDFLEVCPYFDRQFYHARHDHWSPYRNQPAYVGGARQRVFGEPDTYLLSKAPLIKYDLDCVLIGGQHWTNRPPAEIAGETGCLLHFKYVSTFPSYALQEVARKEHYGQGVQYRHYVQGLERHEHLTFYDPQHSVRFRDSLQFVDLGVIERGSNLLLPGGDAPPLTIEFPPIGPPPEGPSRPFWSVLITAYTRLDCVTRALRSVLDQAPGPQSMQIEVVNDAADAQTAAALEAIVRQVGGDRATFYCHPEHLGHPDIFNLCIRRARGHWVHILHDDDWIEQGFYAALAAGIATRPDIGAAFCRHRRTDDAGAHRWLSPQERETPGVLEGWLDNIAVFCSLQFASIAVRREAYEAVGGFCPQAESAFDWDMWKRLACRFPVWYEPRPLANFFQGTASETHRLVDSGQQIAHARQAIALARSYLPIDRADDLSRRALQSYAAYALAVAKEQGRSGDVRAARITIRQGLRCEPTVAVRRALLALSALLTSVPVADAGRTRDAGAQSAQRRAPGGSPEWSGPHEMPAQQRSEL